MQFKFSIKINNKGIIVFVNDVTFEPHIEIMHKAVLQYADTHMAKSFQILNRKFKFYL